jgi:hypothetical protein
MAQGVYRRRTMLPVTRRAASVQSQPITSATSVGSALWTWSVLRVAAKLRFVESARLVYLVRGDV